MMSSASDIITALVVSAVVSVGVSMKQQDTQTRLLEDTILVTKQLTDSVNNLRIQIAVFEEKYVTKSELDKKLKEESRDES